MPPEYIPDFYSQTSQYQLQTRSCHVLQLVETFYNTDAYKYSFMPSSSRLWNCLPPHIIESTTIISFKSLLQDYYYKPSNKLAT